MNRTCPLAMLAVHHDADMRRSLTRPMHRSSDSGAKLSPEAPVDVVIFTVIPVEFHAVMRALNVSSESREKLADGTIYFRGTTFSELLRRDYSFVVTCIGLPGNPGAAAA